MKLLKKRTTVHRCAPEHTITPLPALSSSSFGGSAVSIACALAGCFLVRRLNNRTRRFLITETEAYEGPHDRASHASRGKTARNAVMFGEPGRFYVYFVYGMHWMLNVVTGKAGYPAAVLIRGIEGFKGPGRLTKELRITGKLSGRLANRKSGLWFERNKRVGFYRIARMPRIGVAYAGAVWSKKLYRFILRPKL